MAMHMVRRCRISVLALFSVLVHQHQLPVFARHALPPPLSIIAVKPNPSKKFHFAPFPNKNISQPLLIRDVYESGYEKPHPELCPEQGASIRLIILVASALKHTAARDAVRRTWGQYAVRSDIAFAFVLGAPPESLRSAIAAEDALYGDIIVGKFLDTYSNLTLKTLSMLEWIDTYCPRAPRFLKTDDDMFINVPKLLQFMSAPSHMNATRTIWGYVLRQSLPKRRHRMRYYVPFSQFPRRVFPDYTIGAAYLMTTDVVRDLLAAAPNERYLRLEDVFVTGVLADKVGVKRQHVVKKFYNVLEKTANDTCIIKRGIVIFLEHHQEQFDVWTKLLDRKTRYLQWTSADGLLWRIEMRHNAYGLSLPE